MSFFSFEAVLSLAFVVMTIIFITTVVFFERKNPSATIAWVMVLVFLPVVGFIGYLFIGSGFKISRKKKYRLKAAGDDLYDNVIRQHLNIAEALQFIEDHQNTGRLISCLQNEGMSIYTSNNEVEVFTQGRPLFDRMLADMKEARDHIHMLYFIFSSDSLGQEITEVLTHKAKQGVEVRVIYDSFGTRTLGRPAIFKNLSRAGGQILGFSPLFSNFNSRFRLNYRNHRKIAVVDGCYGYVGGMNISDDSLGLNKKLCPWRDTHLRLSGSSVWFLQERFLMDWRYTNESEVREGLNAPKYYPECHDCGQQGVQIVSGGPDTSESPLKSGLLTMINTARRNIYLQTPYFSPDNSILDALRIAARSQVDVRLMVPDLYCDWIHWLSRMSALGYAQEVLASGVRVFLYPGFLHSKTQVADGLVTSIGTANINNRSYLLDFEINAYVYDSEFAAQNEAIFLADQEQCLELTSQWFEARSGLTRSAYNFARIFAPLM